jgi:hypothetical protein
MPSDTAKYSARQSAPPTVTIVRLPTEPISVGNPMIPSIQRKVVNRIK